MILVSLLTLLLILRHFFFFEIIKIKKNLAQYIFVLNYNTVGFQIGINLRNPVIENIS